jgi:hypothetical protein
LSVIRKRSFLSLPPAYRALTTSYAAKARSSSVLTIYVDLPDTPLQASASDQWLARRLYDDRGPLHVVETALLLGSLRR